MHTHFTAKALDFDNSTELRYAVWGLFFFLGPVSIFRPDPDDRPSPSSAFASDCSFLRRAAV